MRILILFLLLQSTAYAIDPEDYCRAIYIAEGGANTAHPYGIMKQYKHTTPKQACINTITRIKRSCGDDIACIGATYAPIGAKNDPRGLNSNWVRNVTYYVRKGL